MDILVSVGEGSKPDLVVIDRTNKRIELLELICLLPRSSDKVHDEKQKVRTVVTRFGRARLSSVPHAI